MGNLTSCFEEQSYAKADAGIAQVSQSDNPSKQRRNGSQSVALDEYFADLDKDLRRISKQGTYGLVKITVQEAETLEAAEHSVVASIGIQSLLSKTSAYTNRPVWNQSKTLILQREGASVLVVTVYKGGDHIVGRCYVDLSSLFHPVSSAAKLSYSGGSAATAVTATAAASVRDASATALNNTGSSAGGAPQLQHQDSFTEWRDLMDPVFSHRTVGRIRVTATATTLLQLETEFWRRLLSLADFNEDQYLQRDEFMDLLSMLGNTLDEQQLDALFQKADADLDGQVSAEELAALLTKQRNENGTPLMSHCPFTGADLTQHDDGTNLIYMTLAMEQDANEEALHGGLTAVADGSRSWMLKITDWGTHVVGASRQVAASAASVSGRPRGGPYVGDNAAHIYVVNRRTKALEEEVIQPTLILAMRNLYQTSAGRSLLRAGGFKVLHHLTIKQGRYMDSAASVKDIAKFLEMFRGVVDMSEAELQVEEYKNFNEFFYRKLKPEARPIAHKEEPRVAISAADCRLMVFDSVTEATEFWVKGTKFKISTLLGDEQLAADYENGAMAIFRLAPQDYHRFHLPARGRVDSIRDISGQYYTVNPIAVNSSEANVFTENKRSVMTIQSPEFGRYLFVAIGATLVGSINWTAKTGDLLNKGEELGYFAFGGSTIITLFKPNVIVFDEDLVSRSRVSLETLVRMGDKIGRRRPGAFSNKPSRTALLQHKSTSFRAAFDNIFAGRRPSRAQSVRVPANKVAPPLPPGLHKRAKSTPEGWSPNLETVHSNLETLPSTRALLRGSTTTAAPTTDEPNQPDSATAASAATTSRSSSGRRSRVPPVPLNAVALSPHESLVDANSRAQLIPCRRGSAARCC